MGYGDRIEELECSHGRILDSGDQLSLIQFPALLFISDRIQV